MEFLRVNVTFYDAVNVIHDVITTANQFPYAAKFVFVGRRNNKTQPIRRWKIKENTYTCLVLPYIKNI